MNPLLSVPRRFRAGFRRILLAVLAAGAAGAAFAADPPLLTQPRRVGNQFEFTLLGLSNASYRIEATANLQGWAPVATNTAAAATRSISVAAPAARALYRAIRLGTPYFRYSLTTTGAVDLNGLSLYADSFNSANPVQSTGGAYDPAKATDRGDVAALAGLADGVGTGDASIVGNLRVAPGGGMAVGAFGTVGTRAWVLGGNLGIQPGHLFTNLTLNLPAVSPPFAVGITPGSGVVDGTLYSYVLDQGNYQLAALSLGSGQRMYVRGDAALLVSGGVTVAGSASLVLGPNASLRLYVGGANASFSLAGIQNSRRAVHLQIFGLPGNSNVNLLGGPSFKGAVYAPAAQLNFGTAGAGTVQYHGAFVGRAIRLKSPAEVHFDEDLTGSGPSF